MYSAILYDQLEVPLSLAPSLIWAIIPKLRAEGSTVLVTVLIVSKDLKERNKDAIERPLPVDRLLSRTGFSEFVAVLSSTTYPRVE